MNRSLLVPVIFVCVFALLAAGCTTPSQQAIPQQPALSQPGTTPPGSLSPAGDSAYARGMAAFEAGNYRTAEEYFALAKADYSASGDRASFIRARDMRFMSEGILQDYPYNRSQAEAEMATAFPDVPAADRTRWLDRENATTITSDGVVLCYSGTTGNVKFHNVSLMQAGNRAAGHTPLYDVLMPLIDTPWTNGTGPYGAPVAYEGSDTLSIPRGDLPANGTLKIWMPLPIESGAQTTVTILSVEPAKYVKSTTGTAADMGLACLEIPLGEIRGPYLNVTAKFSFVQHEQRFAVDPAKVKPYDTNSSLYKKYTASSGNIVLSPEMKAKAKAVAGNETNPYLVAQKIYWDLISTHPYSHPAHFWLDATKTPESAYVLSTGIGDCGSQSMYYAALLRAAGIPARAQGGYQMIEGTPGTHFWAQFYLEGYGWIPVDVTAAEGGTWAYNATPADLRRYQAYYFGSLDPYRYIIQNDVDIPLTPPAGDAVVAPDGWTQFPKAVCDTCDENPTVIGLTDASLTITRV
jgi:transglutaminase-like putative cysteine protease